MTYRERREARAERLRGWADKRTAEAGATLDHIRTQYHGDHAFNFQPGHIPERARVIAREDRAFASLDKARSMAARADNIERAADHAIYSDDPDAPERLAEKIATLEAERARWTAYNASARKAAKTGGTGDLSILDEAQRADIAGLLRFAYMRKPGNAAPSYVTSNLSGNLSRLRARLAGMSVAR